MIPSEQSYIWWNLCKGAVEFIIRRIEGFPELRQSLKLPINWRTRPGVHKTRMVDPKTCDLLPRRLQLVAFPCGTDNTASLLAAEIINTFARWRPADRSSFVAEHVRDAQMKADYIAEQRKRIADAMAESKAKGAEIMERQAWHRINDGG